VNKKRLFIELKWTNKLLRLLQRKRREAASNLHLRAFAMLLLGVIAAAIAGSSLFCAGC
jgi:hypothetical protein